MQYSSLDCLEVYVDGPVGWLVNNRPEQLRVLGRAIHELGGRYIAAARVDVRLGVAPRHALRRVGRAGDHLHRAAARQKGL